MTYSHDQGVSDHTCNTDQQISLDLLTTECYLTSAIFLPLHASITSWVSVASKWHHHTRVTWMMTLHSFKSGFRRTRDKAQGMAASPGMVSTLTTHKQTSFAWGKCRPPQLSLPEMERCLCLTTQALSSTRKTSPQQVLETQVAAG